jgi:hypothetical protein
MIIELNNIKFTQLVDKEIIYDNIDAFIYFDNNKYLDSNDDIDRLIIKSLDKTIINKTITPNFAKTSFDDDKLFCIMSYNMNDNLNTQHINFESKDEYLVFREKITKMLTTDVQKISYPNGKVAYVGEVLYTDNTGDKDKFHASGKGTIYFDYDKNKIMYIGQFQKGIYNGKGTFYNYSKTISVSCDNIIKGELTKEIILNVNFTNKKDTLYIDTEQMWKDFNLYTREDKINFVNSVNFVDSIANKYLDYDFNEYVFNEKSTDEKILELRNSNIKLASDIIKLRRCYKDSQEIINTYSSSSIILFGLNALTILYIIYK